MQFWQALVWANIVYCTCLWSCFKTPPSSQAAKPKVKVSITLRSSWGRGVASCRFRPLSSLAVWLKFKWQFASAWFPPSCIIPGCCCLCGRLGNIFSGCTAGFCWCNDPVVPTSGSPLNLSPVSVCASFSTSKQPTSSPGLRRRLWV